MTIGGDCLRSSLLIDMPVVTPQAKQHKKDYQKNRYHSLKHTENFVLNRRATEKRLWKRIRERRVFKRLSIYQRKKNGAHISAIDLWKMCLRQKCRCPLTGRKLTIQNMSVDHIKPLSKGGDTSVNNLRLTVKDANLAKACLSDSELLLLALDIVKTLSGSYSP